jgi:hypothetical protein
MKQLLSSGSILKKDFILHSDGAKTELMDLRKLIEENLPLGVHRWDREWVEKEYAEHYEPEEFAMM